VNYCQNRLLLLESWFRKTPLWAFFMLNRKIKQKLFFNNLNRCRAGRKDHSGATADADPETRLFGTVPFFLELSRREGRREGRFSRRLYQNRLLGGSVSRRSPERHCSRVRGERARQELLAIADPAELGLMNAMVTTVDEK